MKKILSVILSLMLVFAGLAPMAFAEGDYTLSDIVVNGGTLVGFNSATNEYNIIVPYVYKANDFKTFEMPEVSATAADSSATVEIVEPATVADGETISINVKDADGTVKNTYTLTMQTAGGNIFVDGGFETMPDSIYGNGSWSAPTREIISSTDGVGNKLLKAYSALGSGVYVAALYDSSANPIISSAKTYVNGLMVKLDSVNAESPFNTSFLPGIVRYQDSTWADTMFSGAYYTYEGTKVAEKKKGLELTDEWGKYMSVVSSDADEKVSVMMSSDSSTRTYFLYDEMYLGELVVADLKVADDNEKTSATVTEGKATTINLTATPANQYGNSVGLTGTTTWKVLNGYTGVTVSDGVVNVAEDAAAGTAVIEATFAPSYKGAVQTAVNKRFAVDILPENFVTEGYELSDIEVNGGGIKGFAQDKSAYDVVVPYVYKTNDFKTFEMPEVSATAADSSAVVEIVKPASVADGGKISILVKDSDGEVKSIYVLTMQTAGENLFVDGGFETNSIDNYDNAQYGSYKREIRDSDEGCGKKVLKAYGSTSQGYYPAGISDYFNPIYLSAEKTYVNGFMVKLDSDRELLFGDTSTDLTSFNTVFKPGIVHYKDSTWSAAFYSGDYYTQGSAVNAGKSFELTENWEKYMSLVSTTKDNQRVAVAIGSPDATPTFFLYDEMYLGELVVANMAVTDEDGKTSGTVAAGETITLTEKHTNQYGNSVGLTGTTTWEVLNNTDVTVDSNGNVTVKDEAAAGTAIIEATFDTDYTGAAQDVVKKRYALTVIPKDGFVDNENGTYTANYTNNTDKDMTLRFISALYEGDVLQTVVITDNITVKVGETYSGSNTLTAGSGQSVRNFLWDKTTLVPVITE